MEQGIDRRNGTRKDSSKNKWKKKEEKSPSKTTLPKVFSLWRGYWQLRVKIFSFPATTEKRKKSWKKKWIEWSELVPVRVEGAEAPVSQLEEGQAANLPFFYHGRRSRGASLALTLPQEGGQAFPPLSYQKEDYGYKLSALLSYRARRTGSPPPFLLLSQVKRQVQLLSLFPLKRDKGPTFSLIL